MKPPTLREIVKPLAESHGEPAAEPPRRALDWILWETVGYLCDDERRAQAYAALKKRTSLAPAKILATPLGELAAIARLGGIHPELRARRFHQIAELVQEEFGGDLDSALAAAPARAPAALKKFPAIGKPGAEKILLMTGARAVLGLESNGLRVLVRLGLGVESRSYDATWRSVAEATAAEVGRCDTTFLARAHRLLRRHGQTICRRTQPRCEECLLAPRCAFFSGPGARPA
jgi:endonuclease III